MNPEVTVVVATYRPNEAFLRSQLRSLCQQRGCHFCVQVRDDSEDEAAWQLVQQVVAQELAAIPYQIGRNDTNCGSNQTFGQLIASTTTPYIAFCDQDDLWDPNKLQQLLGVAKQQQAALVFSAMRVIDEHDRVIAATFSAVNRRLPRWPQDDPFALLLRRNVVTGCSALMSTAVAKHLLPIPKSGYVHDHWLALGAAQQGTVVFFAQSLMAYRLHAHNQIGAQLLRHTPTKEDYVTHRLLPERARYEMVAQRMALTASQQCVLAQAQQFCADRLAWQQKPSWRTQGRLLRWVKQDWQLVLFEWVIGWLPTPWANGLLQRIRR